MIIKKSNFGNISILLGENNSTWSFMQKHIFITFFVALITAFTTSLTTLHFVQRRQSVPYYPQEINTQLVSKVNSPPYNEPKDFSAIAKTVTSSVVSIAVYRGDYRISAGSGVVIFKDGYIVTNYHVIENATSFEVVLSDKRELKATLVGKDPNTDLALLKVDANDLMPLRLGDSDELKVGEWVLAVGNPFNLTSTVTAGIVSAKARSIQILKNRKFSIESFIQTDAVVNPGNSGGALVNARGELVGINTAIISETGGYEGFSFAIPSNLVIKIANDLREFGEVQRAVLGVVIGDVNGTIAKDLKLNKVEGVLVQSVNQGTTASEAKLEPNDVIVAINNVKVKSIPELQEQVARYRPGDIISIDYIRDGVSYRKNNVQLKSLKTITAENDTGN